MRITKKAAITGGALAVALLTLAPAAVYAHGGSGGGWRHGHGDCNEEMHDGSGARQGMFNGQRQGMMNGQQQDMFHGQMQRDRDLTEAEVRKVVEGMLLMQSSEGFKVGEITDGDEGYYKVQILNPDGEPAAEMQMHKRNGRPMHGGGYRR